MHMAAYKTIYWFVTGNQYRPEVNAHLFLYNRDYQLIHAVLQGWRHNGFK